MACTDLYQLLSDVMQQYKTNRGRYSAFKVDFSNYKILEPSDSMPDGYQWLVEGCPVAVPINWLKSVVEQCEGRSSSFLLTMIINGIIRPHEVIHGGTSAYIGTYMEPVINALKCNLSQHQPPQPVPPGIRPGCGYVHPSDAQKWMKVEALEEERKMAGTPVEAAADPASSGCHSMVKQILAAVDSSFCQGSPSEVRRYVKQPGVGEDNRVLSRRDTKTLQAPPRKKKSPSATCEDCGATLCSRQSLANHRAKIHLKREVFECHLCGRMYSSQRYLDNHMSNEHSRRTGNYQPQVQFKQNMLECVLCGHLFSSQLSLDKHMIAEHNVKTE